jgi:hypothetical protein
VKSGSDNPAVVAFNADEDAAFVERGEVHGVSIPGGVYGRLFLFSEPFLTRNQADTLMQAGMPRFNNEVCIW